MTKNSTILTVSIDKTQLEFIESAKLSASALFQEKINEERRRYEQFNTENAKLLNTIENFQKEIRLMYEFIELNGLFDNFRKWRGTYVLEKTE